MFWSGPNKFGPGIRLGVKTDAGETIWINETSVARLDGVPTSAYPFRFYGHGSPSNWLEGANDGHGFTMQFTRTLTEEEWHLLGHEFEAMLSKGPASPGMQPWQWLGPFASFDVGERGSPGAHAIISTVERFLKAAHNLVPIVDATYFNACDGMSSWHEWSMQQGPPDPGPFDQSNVGVFRERDPALGPTQPCDAFEAGRKSFHDATRRRTSEAELAQQTKGKGIWIERRDENEIPAPPASPAPDLSGFEAPEPRFVVVQDFGMTWERLCRGDHPQEQSAGPRVALVVEGDNGEETNVAWIDTEGIRQTPERWKPAIEIERIYQVRTAPSGEYAVLGVIRKGWPRKEYLFRLDFQSGRAKAFYTCDESADGSLGNFEFMAGGTRLALCTTKRLMVIDPARGQRSRAGRHQATPLLVGGLRRVCVAHSQQFTLLPLWV